jgi:hypothetical protein
MDAGSTTRRLANLRTFQGGARGAQRDYGKDLDGTGVTVNVLVPDGVTDTPMISPPPAETWSMIPFGNGSWRGSAGIVTATGSPGSG